MASEGTGVGQKNSEAEMFVISDHGLPPAEPLIFYLTVQ